MLRRREWMAVGSAALLAVSAVAVAAWEEAAVVEVRVQGAVPAEVARIPPTTSTRTMPVPGRVVWAESGDIWLYEDETGERRTLTGNGPARRDFLPRFRDSDRITYLSSDDRDTDPTLMELSLRTGHTTMSTPLRGAVRSYDWSPDGETLAYYGAAAEDEATALHVVGSGGSLMRSFRPILGRGRFVNWDETRVEWSPDGRHLLVLDTALDAAVGTSPVRTLHVLNPDGTDAIPPRDGTWARWSSDGRTVYCFCVLPVATSEGCAWQAIDVATGAISLLPVAAAARPSVSPDGRMLAFDDGEDTPSVHVVDLDDAGARPRFLARAAIAPVWLSATRLAVTDTKPCPGSTDGCEAGGHGSMFHPAGTASVLDLTTGRRSPLPPIGTEEADTQPTYRHTPSVRLGHDRRWGRQSAG